MIGEKERGWLESDCSAAAGGGGGGGGSSDFLGCSRRPLSLSPSGSLARSLARVP